MNNSQAGNAHIKYRRPRKIKTPQYDTSSEELNIYSFFQQVTNGTLRHSTDYAHTKKQTDSISFVQQLSNHRRRMILDAMVGNRVKGEAYDEKTMKMFDSY